MAEAIGILILITPCVLFPPLGIVVVGFIVLRWVFLRLDGPRY